MSNTTSNNKNENILKYFNDTQNNHEWSHYMSEGPHHMPTFKIYLYLNDTQFEGKGSSKKKAKINAIQKFNNSNVTNSCIVGIKGCNKRCIEEAKTVNTPCKKRAIDSNHIAPEISAISILHEVFPGQSINYIHEQSHGLLETISVNILGKKYLGYGKNKKEAKEIACRNAIKALYDIHPIDPKYKDQIEILRTDYDDSKIIDQFAYLTNDLYQNLEFDDIKFKEYSVIASIIKVNSLLLIIYFKKNKVVLLSFFFLLLFITGNKK